MSLKNISLTKDTLFATLYIKDENTRRINTIIIKGYDNISKKILKFDLDIRKNDVFNKRKLRNISTLTKAVPYLEEIKAPEVLFTKDSTLLYVYLKKKSNNSFDGIVSFASNENKKGILFNGTADLKLNNLLHGGESLSIFWNSIGDEKQEFSLKTKIPYIFNSRVTPEIRFNLYKQDSVFLNTEFYSKILYKLNQKSSISINYSSLTSNNLKESIMNNNIESFDKSLLGLGYQFQDFLSNSSNGLYIYFEGLFGSRKSVISKSEQTKFNLEVSNTFVLNNRSHIYLKNETGILSSDTFLDNEVYRIGGANSIRGFNEQSIFTSQFSYINLEYRYLTSKTSYLYTISDFGLVKGLNSSNQSLIGIGLGYLFTVKNSQVNIGYALGKSSSSNFNFDNSKIIINFKSYF